MIINGQLGIDNFGDFICINSSRASITDKVLTDDNALQLVSFFSVGDLMGSDHLLLQLELQSLDPCILLNSPYDSLI